MMMSKAFFQSYYNNVLNIAALKFFFFFKKYFLLKNACCCFYCNQPIDRTLYFNRGLDLTWLTGPHYVSLSEPLKWALMGHWLYFAHSEHYGSYYFHQGYPAVLIASMRHDFMVETNNITLANASVWKLIKTQSWAGKEQRIDQLMEWNTFSILLYEAFSPT